ncbi:hypothetical protein [Streptomyces sp. NPDC053427]|uniref:hypothetical protein n=1 Tax=Streptomyces sp. NPDC053427 TaxID=3365701 RepID=UPI0037D6E3D7
MLATIAAFGGALAVLAGGYALHRTRRVRRTGVRVAALVIGRRRSSSGVRQEVRGALEAVRGRAFDG